AMLHSAVRRELLLEGVHLAAEDEPVLLDDPIERGAKLAHDLLVLRAQVYEGDAHVAIKVARSEPRSRLPGSVHAMAGQPVNDSEYRLIEDVDFGDDVSVFAFANLYGCRIGSRTRIGAFVEVQRGAVIGDDCKIQSHSFVCD